MVLKQTTSVLSLALVVSIVGTTLAETEPVSQKAASKEARRTKLLGAWAFAGRPDSTNKPKPSAPLKVFGLKHFVVVVTDPETGEVMHVHGGTYSLKDDTYTELVKFGNDTREFLIGETFGFKIKVDGDVLVQEGIGNNFNERWVRQTPDE